MVERTSYITSDTICLRFCCVCLILNILQMLLSQNSMVQQILYIKIIKFMLIFETLYQCRITIVSLIVVLC